ncbi:DUF3221 domain-containing protein [Mesobacillus subterraneus]|nr:DUF3221 domain-containing protein [Mesobacillus subterraneus]
MAKRTVMVLFLVLMSMVFAGCASKESASGAGYVLYVNEDSLLIAQNIDAEKYKEIQEVSPEALIDQGGLDLIRLTYDKAEDFKKGDHVEFRTDGGIRESYPAQADAKKVSLSTK